MRINKLTSQRTDSSLSLLDTVGMDLLASLVVSTYTPGLHERSPRSWTGEPECLAVPSRSVASCVARRVCTIALVDRLRPYFRTRPLAALPGELFMKEREALEVMMLLSRELVRRQGKQVLGTDALFRVSTL